LCQYSHWRNFKTIITRPRQKKRSEDTLKTKEKARSEMTSEDLLLLKLERLMIVTPVVTLYMQLYSSKDSTKKQTTMINR